MDTCHLISSRYTNQKFRTTQLSGTPAPATLPTPPLIKLKTILRNSSARTGTLRTQSISCDVFAYFQNSFHSRLRMIFVVAFLRLLEASEVVEIEEPLITCYLGVGFIRNGHCIYCAANEMVNE